MPDVIQQIDITADNQKGKEQKIQDLLADSDSSRAEKHVQQEKAEESTVQIRQSVRIGRGNKGQHLRYNFLEAVVQLNGIVKLFRNVICPHQRLVCGKGNRSGHQKSENGEQSNLSEPEKELPESDAADDTQNKEIDRREDTDDESDVIVGSDRKGQDQRIQPEPAFRNQAVNAKRQQRKQHNRIQPHDIPVIPHHIAAERKADGEHGQGQIIPLKHPVQIDSAE